MTAYDAVLKVNATAVSSGMAVRCDLTVGAPDGAANANDRTSQLCAPL